MNVVRVFYHVFFACVSSMLIDYSIDNHICHRQMLIVHLNELVSDDSANNMEFSNKFIDLNKYYPLTRKLTRLFV